MSTQKVDDLPPSPPPAKELWETPRMVVETIKDNTGYYAPPHDDQYIPPHS